MELARVRLGQVAGRDPRPAQLELADAAAVVRHRGAGLRVDQPQLHPGQHPALAQRVIQRRVADVTPARPGQRDQPQALAWNIGTTIRPRSLALSATALAVHSDSECR